MSHSPSAAGEARESYLAGWSAVNKFLRRGHSWSGHERNCAFLATEDGRFADVSAVSGVDFADDGRSVARLDWDDDGDLDLFIASRSGPRLRYLQNELAQPASSLSFELVGTHGNRDAIGARVELVLRSGAPRIAGVRAGEGFLAQSSKRVHFGLGPDDVPEALRVRWPGTQRYEEHDLTTALEQDERAWVVTEGAGLSVRERSVGRRLAASLPVPPPARGRARVVLAAPVPMPAIDWLSPEGRTRSLFGADADAQGPARRASSSATGSARRPLLVNLWASWCAPCVGELREFTQRSAEIRQAGIDCIALSVDDDDSIQAAELFLQRLDWPFARGRAPLATVDLLDALRGILLDREDRLPVPTSFLVDGEGRLRVLYLGPVGADTLIEDARLCSAEPSEQRDAAVPFAGTWRAEPWPADLAFFEGRLLKRGYRAGARQFHLAQFETKQADEGELRWRFARSLGEAGRFEEAVEHFRAALAADPYLVDAWRDLGVALHRLGNFEGAAQAYAESLRLQPDDATTHYQLGLTHLRRGDLAGAEHQVERLEALGDPRAAELTTWVKRLQEQ